MQAETRAKIEALFERYPQRRGALLPAVRMVQEERGWVDTAQARELALLFDLAPAEVWEVLSFYNLFYTEPQGRHHVYVCTNLPCSLRGGRAVLRALEAHLGVRAGGTSSDGRISLGHEECLGSCGTAPVIRIDEKYCEGVTPEASLQLVDALE